MSRTRKILLIILAIAAVLAIACFVFIARANKNLEALSSIQVEDIDLTAAKDGTYTGSYAAFPVSVTVEVTVTDSKIAAISLVKHVNGQGGAAESIPDTVVETQSLQVDAVSGATYSSKVILLAIEDALQSAAGK